MSDKELYQKKLKAQLDEWQADVEKLQAKAAKAGADTQIEIKKQVALLEKRMDEGRDKLAEIAAASNEAWASLKGGAEAAWSSMNAAFTDAMNKFK